MARYIDVEKALELKNEKMNWVYDLTDLEDFLADVPTADVVEVVRCKDCKHLQRGHSCVYRVDGIGYKNVSLDDFCSYGERRDT